MLNSQDSKAGFLSWILNNFVLTKKRQLEGLHLSIANFLAGFLALFYMYTSGFGVFSPESHRGVFLTLTLMLLFLWHPTTRKSPKNNFTIIDTALAIMTLLVGIYFVMNYSTMVQRPGQYLPVEIALGFAIIVLSLEGARRSVGIILPLLGILMLLFAYKGVAVHLPSVFAHPGFNWTRIASFMLTSTDGIFGVVDYTLATYVMPFVIFGAFLGRSGVGKFFIDLPYALLARYPAGAAQVAVVGSALMGTISGSPVANVVSTGTFTIPFMKKAGYRPEFAAAVESVASSGGMFTPPVMGAAAFFMVEFTGIPYVEVIKVAAIPAILYYLGVMTIVQVETAKRGLKGISADELPSALKVLKEGWFLVIPLVVIVGFLITDFSPNIAAFWASLSCIAVSWLKKGHRMGLKEIWGALVDAGREVLTVAAVTGTMGILVGVLNLTGLGLRLSEIILGLSHGNLLLTIIMVAMAAFILGMGAPITAVYVILAVIAPPAMIKLGVPMIAAHLLLIWYSQMSGLTPPVCLVAFAASAIAQSDPMRTGLEAIKLGCYLLIIPLLFVYTPLLLTGTPFENGLAIVTSFLAVILVAFFVQRYFLRHNKWWEQALLFLSAFLLFSPHLMWNIAGAILGCMTLLPQLLSWYKGGLGIRITS